MTFDREVYFAGVRSVLFDGALSQQQVDGQNIILALWEIEGTGSPMTDVRWLAYMLATTYHETAYKMWPVTEYGSDSYLKDKDYYPYVGRGYVQLTWEENYRNASAALGLIDDRDLVVHPEVALDSLIAARIMFRGMAEGWFTGAKLGQYFNGTADDPYNARRIINGTDCAEMIAGYHDQFLAAVHEASSQEPSVAKGPDTVTIDIQAMAVVPDGIDLKVTLNGQTIVDSKKESNDDQGRIPGRH